MSIPHTNQGCCKKNDPKKPPRLFKKAHLKKPTKITTLYFSIEKSTKK